MGPHPYSSAPIKRGGLVRTHSHGEGHMSKKGEVRVMLDKPRNSRDLSASPWQRGEGPGTDSASRPQKEPTVQTPGCRSVLRGYSSPGKLIRCSLLAPASLFPLAGLLAGRTGPRRCPGSRVRVSGRGGGHLPSSGPRAPPPVTAAPGAPTIQ